MSLAEILFMIPDGAVNTKMSEAVLVGPSLQTLPALPLCARSIKTPGA